MNLIIGEKAKEELKNLHEDVSLPTQIDAFDVTAAKDDIKQYIIDQLAEKYHHNVIDVKMDWIDFHQVNVTDIVWGDEI